MLGQRGYLGLQRWRGGGIVGQIVVAEIVASGADGVQRVEVARLDGLTMLAQIVLVAGGLFGLALSCQSLHQIVGDASLVKRLHALSVDGARHQITQVALTGIGRQESLILRIGQQ